MTARISLTMIVKNESATLGRCLTSVRDLVDEIVIVDTGSFGNTKDIARQHGAKGFDLPWWKMGWKMGTFKIAFGG